MSLIPARRSTKVTIATNGAYSQSFLIVSTAESEGSFLSLSKTTNAKIAVKTSISGKAHISIPKESVNNETENNSDDMIVAYKKIKIRFIRKL